MSFSEGENSDLTLENKEQEEKIKIEETAINLGYVKKEFENEEAEFWENQYKIGLNFNNISLENSEKIINGHSLIGFLDGDAIMTTESVKLEDVKEENKDLIQETIKQSKLEIIQCHLCKVLFEEWELLENHMLHCLHDKYNRLYNKLDIQQNPAYKMEETQGNREISTTIDDNRSCLTLTERIDTKYADGIGKLCEKESLSQKRYKCSECAYESSYKSCLKLHISNRHSNTNEKKYKCSECSYQTNYESNLKRHLNKHYKTKLFECEICKKTFTLKDSLKAHVRDQHSNTNEKKYKCSQCYYQSNRKFCLNVHILNRHSNIIEKKYKCTECSHQTNCKRDIEIHLNAHYNIKPFDCDVCKKKFTSKDNLKAHLRDKHSNTNDKKYKCTECSYKTNYKGNLKTHLSKHNNIQPFECDICKKKFNWKASLKKHMNVHSNTKEKKYKCAECAFQTNVKSILKTHLKLHKIKSFECDICKKKYSRKNQLKVHIEDKHSNINEMKYKSTQCAFQTNDIDYLKTYVNADSNCFECDVCKIKFTKKSSLKVHFENKHSNSNDKKYKCTECSYQTNRKCDLEIHLNSHYNIKPFECNICKKKYFRNNHLKLHIIDKHSNSNEKKYKCTKCSFQTNAKSYLKKHLNIHNNIKLFECDICKKKYTWKNSLQLHIMNIHSKRNEKK